jgi:hypothetical protein
MLKALDVVIVIRGGFVYNYEGPIYSWERSIGAEKEG